jgi:hypothetical protein
LTKKRADFELFIQVVEIMKRKEHLTVEGLNQIVGIRASPPPPPPPPRGGGVNNGLTENLKRAFPNITECERPKFEELKSLDPFWLAGFVEGEGCFEVKVTNPTTSNQRGQISLRFTITHHSRDSFLINSFMQYLGCGRSNVVLKISRFVVLKFPDIQQKIIPFFAKYPRIPLWTILVHKGQEPKDRIIGISVK